MMGQHSRSEALFYYFRLEDQVPENHLLRLIEKHISLPLWMKAWIAIGSQVFSKKVQQGFDLWRKARRAKKERAQGDRLWFP
jgi:hypothetical protein